MQSKELQSTRKAGEIGEGIAKKYLIANNWKILARNFYVRGGEIDLIALDQNCLVFIEVKFRTSDQFGKSTEQFSFQKKKRIKRASLKFLQRYLSGELNLQSYKFNKTRYDFISVTKASSQKLKIKHFKNVEM